MAEEYVPTAIDPALDLFQVPDVDRSVSRVIATRIPEQNTGGQIPAGSRQQWIFYDKITENYREYHDGCIEVGGYLASNDGATPPHPVAANGIGRVELESSLLGIIDTMTLYVGNHQVEVVQNAAIRAIITGLLFNRTNRQKEKDDWWFPETYNSRFRGLAMSGVGTTSDEAFNKPFIEKIVRHNHIAQSCIGDADLTGATKLAGGDATDLNDAYVGGKALADPSKQFVIRLPLKLCFGFFRDVKACIVGEHIKIVVNLQSNARAGVMKAYVPTTIPPVNPADFVNAVQDVRFVPTSAYMWMNQLIPSTKVASDLLQSRMTGERTIYMFKQHDVINLGKITAAGSSASLVMNARYSNLSKLYVFVQSMPRTDSTRQVFNQSIFDPLNLTVARMDVNGTQFPEGMPYNLDGDWQGGIADVPRLYDEFVKAQIENGVDLDGVLDFQSFLKAYPITTFDLSKLGEALVDNNSQKNMSLTLTWATTPVPQLGYQWLNGGAVQSMSGVAAANAATAAPNTTDFVNAGTDQAYTVWGVLEYERSIFATGTKDAIVFDSISSI